MPLSFNGEQQLSLPATTGRISSMRLTKSQLILSSMLVCDISSDYSCCVLAVCSCCCPVPNRAGGPWRALPCHGVQAEWPIQGARAGFALERKHLCDGRRPLSHGCGLF